MEKLTITLDSGFTFEVEQDALDDMEVYEKLKQLQNGTGYDKPDALHAIFEKAAGPEQIKAFKQHLMETDGKIRRTKYEQAAAMVFKALADNGKK